MDANQNGTKCFLSIGIFVACIMCSPSIMFVCLSFFLLNFLSLLSLFSLVSVLPAGKINCRPIYITQSRDPDVTLDLQSEIVRSVVRRCFWTVRGGGKCFANCAYTANNNTVRGQKRFRYLEIVKLMEKVGH